MQQGANEQEDDIVRKASLNMQVLPNQNITGTVRGKNQRPENFSGGSDLLALQMHWFGKRSFFVCVRTTLKEKSKNNQQYFKKLQYTKRAATKL